MCIEVCVRGEWMHELMCAYALATVHSAGIGRTGTFMAIDSGMQQLQSEWRVCDIKGTVTKMRKERGGSVQTAVQYRFIHLALAEYCTPSLAHSMFGSNEPR